MEQTSGSGHITRAVCNMLTYIYNQWVLDRAWGLAYIEAFTPAGRSMGDVEKMPRHGKGVQKDGNNDGARETVFVGRQITCRLTGAGGGVGKVLLMGRNSIPPRRTIQACTYISKALYGDLPTKSYPQVNMFYREQIRTVERRGFHPLNTWVCLADTSIHPHPPPPPCPLPGPPLVAISSTQYTPAAHCADTQIL